MQAEYLSIILSTLNKHGIHTPSPQSDLYLKTIPSKDIQGDK